MTVATTSRQIRRRERRGTKTQVLAASGLLGELLLATDPMALYIHDGSLAIPVTGRMPGRALNGDTLLTAQDVVVVVDATGGDVVITLPNAAVNINQVLIVKKIDASVNLVTVSGAGGQTIDGAGSVDLTAQYASLTLWSDGSNWHVIGKVT